MSYLLDANVFMTASRLHYGFDFCPAFWDWLVAANKAKRVFSIERVASELAAGGQASQHMRGEGCRGTFLRMDAEEQRAARRARAEARRAVMTVEVVPLGTPKAPPYADSSADERLAAATQLIEYHQALRGRRSALPRSEWPGETFVISANRG
jgi:hypothetical protein